MSLVINITSEIELSIFIPGNNIQNSGGNLKKKKLNKFKV